MLVENGVLFELAAAAMAGMPGQQVHQLTIEPPCTELFLEHQLPDYPRSVPIDPKKMCNPV